MEKVLNLNKISRLYESVTALEEISFSVNKGEWVAVMGPSGSGKTTLLNILTCLDEASSGEYFLDGIDIKTLNEKDRTAIRREKIGLVFQQFHLLPYLSALENVMLAQHYHSVVDKDQAMEMLTAVGLSHREKHLPSELSGGEQQRVCIARAMINQPPILFADEPTGNLDEANENLIIELFEKLRQSGKTILMVTHNPKLTQNVNRMITLNHGRIESDKINQSKPYAFCN